MRILFYALHYGPDPGGAGPFNWQLGSWLRERGHELTVISTPPHYPQWQIADRYKGAGEVREELDGVEVFRVPLKVPHADELTARNRILHETSFNASALRRWLPAFLTRRKFDVVLAVCPPLQSALPALAYSRLRRVPFVFFLHDLQVGQAVDLKMITNPHAVRMLFRIERSLLRGADRVAAHTEHMRTQVIRDGIDPNHVWLLPHWADTSAIRPGERMNGFRQELGVGADKVLAIYAGGMGEKHGLDVVVDAAAKLRDHRDLEFVLIGAGPKRTELEAQVASLGLTNLRMWPLQPIARMPEIMAASDILLVTGKGEAVDRGFPAKLTNIWAAGRTSVAIAREGTAVHQILTDHGIGAVVQPDDPSALAEALAAVASDPLLRERYATRAREYALEHVDQDRVLGRFERNLVELVSAR